MALKKKINFRKVRTIIIDSRVDKLRKEGFNLKHGIESRTRSGKDMNMKSFKEYSPSYKKYKKSKGRSGKVDLTMKNHMLPAIVFKKIANGIRFKFNTSAETKKASWNQKLRKFFGVDKQQIKYLKKKMGKL